MDKTIDVLIYLFILSIITEKIVTLIRRFPLHFQILMSLLTFYLGFTTVFSFFEQDYNIFYVIFFVFSLFLFLISFVPLLNLKFNIPYRFYNFIRLSHPFRNIKKGIIGVNENRKENEVSLLSFFIGLLVALSFNSDFFIFFSTKVEEISPIDLNQYFKDWNHFRPIHDFSFRLFIGVLATGFFLSFGSKFFYELLELFFQIRNLRAKQGDEATYKVKNVDDLETILSTTVPNQIDIVQTVYDREAFNVFKIPGVNGFSISKIWKNNKTLRGLKILTTKPSLIREEQFQYKGNDGVIIQIPIAVITADVAKICTDVFPSAMIMNKNMKNKFGTLCIPVIDDSNGNYLKDISKKIYFLSCYHVVKHTDHTWKNFATNGNEDVILRDGTVIGDIVKAEFSETIDAALIEKSPELDISNINTIIGDIKIKAEKVREISSNEINSLNIKMRGASTVNGKDGFIVGYNNKKTIKYDEPNMTIEISGLLELQDNSFNNPIASDGDSGALIYDSEGEAIAMVIATDNVHSYAIPLNVILNKFKVKIYNSNFTTS